MQEHKGEGYHDDTAYPDTETVETNASRKESRPYGIPAVAYGCVLSQDEILGCSSQLGIPLEAFSEYQEANAGLWDVPTYYVDCDALNILMEKAGSSIVVEHAPGGMYVAGLPMEKMPNDMVLKDYGDKALDAIGDIFPVKEDKELVFFPYEEPRVQDEEDSEDSEESEEPEAPEGK